MAFTDGDKIACPKDIWTQVTDANSIIQFTIPWNVTVYYIENSIDPNTLYSSPDILTQPILELNDGRSNNLNFKLKDYMNTDGPLWIYPVNQDVSCQLGV